jgi:predicted TIM-barrel fold metal-dependent hydrolase
LNVPVIVHTGAGAPNALPSLLMPRAKEFPDVRIVLSHAGAFIYTEEAIIVAKHYGNIYLEPSWCGAPQLRQMINAIGIERIMFGSDGPQNVGPELAKVEAIDMTDREKELYLGKNAINFYDLKI